MTLWLTVLAILCAAEAIPLAIMLKPSKHPHWEYTCKHCGDHRTTRDDAIFQRWLYRHATICAHPTAIRRIHPEAPR